MTVKDFATDLCMEGFFDNYIDESYWEQNFSPEYCLQKTWLESLARDVVLTGIDEFKYEDFFYQVYKDNEKGLS